jgi:hypothetical protein
MELKSSLLWSNMSLRDLFSSRSGGVGLLVRNSIHNSSIYVSSESCE